jgi:ribosomal protein L39E
MARNKEMEKKDFLIASRKKVGQSITKAPFWAVRKKGKRILEKKQKRHWKTSELGKDFKKAERRQAKKTVKGKPHFKKGKANRQRW